MCVILCIIFKTFNAFNVCKFIIIIIIFKMGVCEAREHSDQDKRSSNETPQQTLQDKIPSMPCNNLIISLLITSKFTYIHINIWSNACKNHPKQSNWRGSICLLNQMKWLTQIHYPKFPLPSTVTLTALLTNVFSICWIITDPRVRLSSINSKVH